MARIIKITISADGEDVQIKTSGFAGAECRKATAELETALGTVTGRKHTDEYHKVPTESHRNTEKANG